MQQGKVVLTAKVSRSLADRMDDFVKSPVAGMRSRTHLVETAIIAYLDQEEPIVHELEKSRLKIQKKLSKKTE